LVVPRNAVEGVRSRVRRWRFRKTMVMAGGAERADSVRIGLNALPSSCGVLLVHDAARPLLSRDMVERVAEAARRTGAALAAWPAVDTLKESREVRGERRKRKKSGQIRFLVKKTIPRERMWMAQTPQGFRRDVWEKIRRRRLGPATDDAQWAERLGFPWNWSGAPLPISK